MNNVKHCWPCIYPEEPHWWLSSSQSSGCWSTTLWAWLFSQFSVFDDQCIHRCESTKSCLNVKKEAWQCTGVQGSFGKGLTGIHLLIWTLHISCGNIDGNFLCLADFLRSCAIGMPFRFCILLLFLWLISVIKCSDAEISELWDNCHLVREGLCHFREHLLSERRHVDRELLYTQSKFLTCSCRFSKNTWFPLWEYFRLITVIAPVTFRAEKDR